MNGLDFNRLDFVFGFDVEARGAETDAAEKKIFFMMCRPFIVFIIRKIIANGNSNY